MKNIKKSLRSVFCALLAAAALAASLPAYAVSQAEIDDLDKRWRAELSAAKRPIPSGPGMSDP